jgi:hypothetical protein
VIKEAFAEAAKGAPPVLVAAVTLNDVLVAVSVAYVVLQAAYLARKWWREEGAWSKEMRRLPDRIREAASSPAPLEKE